MARPNKYNLQYFPLEVNFFEDHKVLMIEEDYGFKGGYIAVRLLAMVYEQGYYLDWKDRQELSIAKRMGNGIAGAMVLDVLKSCLKHGLFDKPLFDGHMVLSSRGIQKRWLQVMTQLRRKPEVNYDFWLVSSEETPPPETLTPPSETFSTQKESKVNEIKEKKIRVEGIGHPPTPGRKIFNPPDLKQLQEYFIFTIGNSKNANFWPRDKCFNEASTLLDHYTANGWQQGRGKKIIDWKAACRNWIRNDLKGAFSKNISPGPKKIIELPPALPPPKDKVQGELDYLLEKFIEDETTVTTISIDPEHYNCLKRKGFINFTEERKNEIKQLAEAKLNGAATAQSLIDMMKRIGVIEYFKSRKAETTS